MLNPAVISKFIRELSKVKLCSVLGRTDVSVEEADLKDDPVYARRMAMILVASGVLKMTLKVQYNIPDVIKISETLDADTPKEIDSLMKEYCNLVGGTVKRILEDTELIVGLSIPVAYRGFDEIFSPEEEQGEFLRSKWGLSCDRSTVYFSLTLQSADKKMAETICDAFKAAKMDSEKNHLELF